MLAAFRRVVVLAASRRTARRSVGRARGLDYRHVLEQAFRASISFAELECRVPVKHPARQVSGRLDATAVQVAVVLHLGVAIGSVVGAASTALPIRS